MSSGSSARLLGREAVSREPSAPFKRDDFHLDPLPAAARPTLNLTFESSPSLSLGNGNPHVPWQQPYSELSRFPSASYRFRAGRDGRTWPPEGSQYMTPLPSPSTQSRSRSTSDAASETSFVSETASTSSKPGTSKSKTLQFFQSADSAMSPPPPPRMPSADYDHRKKLDWTPSSMSTHSFPLGNTSSPPRASTSLHSHRLLDGSHADSLASSSPPADFESDEAIQPLSNLPSNFRTEPNQSRSNGTHITSKSSNHYRSSSGNSLAFAPSALGKNSSVIESPLASPTEMPSSRWVKELPSRLPTLLTDQQETSSPSRTSTPLSRAPQLSLSSLSLEGSSGTCGATGDALPYDQPATPAQETEPGTILKGRYKILRHLGLGSFSRVVLAKRLALGTSDSDVAASTRRNHQRMPSGPYPTSLPKIHARNRSRQIGGEEDSDCTSVDSLVAIKLISRSHIKKNDRMRISIVREVEVLKHIRHPSLVHLTSSFETPWHTCLVLEYAAGGELFEFIANHHQQTSEALVRRIFGELADVLGWMHSIGLVHRDIKLENILLTTDPFASVASTGWPDPAYLPPIPTPLVKLTDFGLSRFVDLSSPYLETRCGSEEYAAPELIMGKRYDGRQTDAWALGVVLYALLVGQLPFVEDGGGASPNGGDKSQVSPGTKGSMRSRKAYLLKIAKGEYHWPSENIGPSGDTVPTDETRLVNERSKTLVGGLLARDPKKRLRTEQIWDLEWMSGPGMPEKRFIRGGGLEGVALTAFGGEGEAMVRAELPDPG